MAKRYGTTENSAATAARNSICLIAPEHCMNMRRLHLPYTVLNTREDRNTRNSSEKKWENIWEILSAAYRRTYVEVTKDAIAAGVLPQDIINGYMITAMGEVGQRFQDGKAFVPQLLMAGRAMKGALELLKPLLAGNASATIGKIVIGTDL